MTATAELAPERRRLPREARRERVLVQFVRRSRRLGHGPIVRGCTVDISESGLLLESDVPLPSKCLLHLWVAIEGERKYVLDGECRWRSVLNGGSAYRTGIALLPRAADYAAWQRRFQHGARVLLFPWRLVSRCQ